MRRHVFLARWKRDILCRYRAKDWIPANRLRFQHIMDVAMGSMNQQMSQPMPFVFPVWFGIVGSLPIFAVILWFLCTSKQAFAAPL